MMRKSFLSVLFVTLLLNNPVWAGVSFDKVDDALTCGTSDNLLQENQAQTVSLWIYPISVGENNFGRMIKKGNDTNDVFFHLNNAATPTLTFRVNGGTQLIRAGATSSITVNQWQHVLYTWDGSTTAANVHIYVNGTEISYATTTNGATPTDNSASEITIGNNAGLTRTFDGLISEMAVWSSVLLAQDIAILSKSRTKRIPLQISPSTLEAYWPLDEEEDGSSGDADSFFDMSGNGNTCTGNDGADNLGLTAKAEEVLSYP